ncbi:MAG TPA: hypothetical protein VMU59_15685 [Caulobacteraceae bacterium]|nr:hypothetical protein [Caulobacteraceae bacterium]
MRTQTMSGKAWIKARRAAVLAAALTLGGCAFWHHKSEPPIPPGADPRTTCPKDNPCSKIANRRQYFNQRENRYYYFDQTTGRYFWENGEARFPQPAG